MFVLAHFPHLNSINKLQMSMWCQCRGLQKIYTRTQWMNEHSKYHNNILQYANYVYFISNGWLFECKQTNKQTKQFKTHTDFSCFQLAATEFNFSMECTYFGSLKTNFKKYYIQWCLKITLFYCASLYWMVFLLMVVFFFRNSNLICMSNENWVLAWHFNN